MSHHEKDPPKTSLKDVAAARHMFWYDLGFDQSYTMHCSAVASQPSQHDPTPVHRTNRCSGWGSRERALDLRPGLAWDKDSLCDLPLTKHHLPIVEGLHHLMEDFLSTGNCRHRERLLALSACKSLQVKWMLRMVLRAMSPGYMAWNGMGRRVSR